jgi:hypothetical protein
VAAGALADALDVAASAMSWQDLPRLSRWLVVGSAGAASCVGVAGAAYLATASRTAGRTSAAPRAGASAARTSSVLR